MEHQFASNSPINSIDLDGLEKDEIIDAISKGASWTGKLLKETASGIVASALHPIDAGVAIFHSTKKTVSQVGYFGGVFVQGVGYAFGGKQIEVNQEEFDKTAQDLSKSMVKTGVLAVVTTGIGEAYKAAPKIPIKTALNEAASTLPISEPVRGGARRAAQFAQGWAGASLKEAIKKFAPEAEGVATTTGKTLFTNSETGIQVVYDNAGNYFRIENTKLPGARKYLDLEGNIPNNKTIDGRQMGRSKGEYQEVTHFNNSDE